MGFWFPALVLPIVRTRWKEFNHIFQMQIMGPNNEDILFVIKHAQFISILLRLCQIVLTSNVSKRSDASFIWLRLVVLVQLGE